MELRKYQQEAIDAIMHAPGGFILGDACGLGKTATAVSYGRQRCQSIARPQYLAIVPKTLRSQWEDEIHDWDPDIPVHQVLFNGPVIGEGWFIAHYEQLTTAGGLPTYLNRVWDLVVVDEAHRIKNPTTLRSKAVRKFEAAMKLCLTGTPMEKSPLNLWPMLNWHDRREFRSLGAFRARYVEMDVNWAGYPVMVGPKNLADLAQRLKGRFLARTKEQVAPEMPKLQIVKVKCPPDASQEWVHKAITEADDIIVEVGNKELVIQNTLVKIVRCQQLASFPPILGFNDTKGAKTAWLREWLSDNPDIPAVIFTKFRETAQYLHSEFGGELCIGGAPATGAFRSGEVRLVFATIAYAGEGFNFPRAEAAIFVDQEWSTIKMSQALDRIHRIGAYQDIPKTAYMLQTFPEDRLVYRAFTEKWSEVTMVSKYLTGDYE